MARTRGVGLAGRGVALEALTGFLVTHHGLEA